MAELSPQGGSPSGPILDPVNPGPRAGGGGKSALPRWLVWTLLGGVSVVLVVVGQQMRQTEFAEGKKKAQPKAATLAPKADQEVWLATAGGQMKSLEKTMETQSKVIADLQRELEKLKKDQRKGPPGPAGAKGEAGPPGGVRIVPGGLGKAGGRAGSAAERHPPPPPASALPPLPLAPTPAGSSSNTGAAPAADRGELPAAGAPTGGGGKSGAKPPGPEAAGKPAGPPAERIRVFKAEPVALAARSKYFINTGTLIPVQLLSGIDAPANARGMGGMGGGGRQQPYPVLMVVNNLAFLPNDYRLNLRECFVLGEGIGELSSERTQIRVLGLSCVKKNGQATDVGLKGVLTGEDGKVGLRGRVVMREGALLYRSLLAGFVSGLSRAFLPFQQGFFISQNPQQLLQFPDPQLVGISGLAGGLGRSAELLSRFYMTMARSIFPVIEIDAGRKGVLIVTEGKELPDTPL